MGELSFSLVAEGGTDIAVLKNILCGVFGKEIYNQITSLQPQVDATDKKQTNYGTWQFVFTYLKGRRFRQYLESVEERDDYVVIQIDTDVSSEEGFNVYPRYDDHNELLLEELIEDIKQRLIQEINSIENSLFQNYGHRIIFAICVHSLECWIFALHNSDKKNKIVGCFEALERLIHQQRINDRKIKKMKGLVKTGAVYHDLSKLFAKQNIPQNCAQKNESFAIFLDELQAKVVTN